MQARRVLIAAASTAVFCVTAPAGAAPEGERRLFYFARQPDGACIFTSWDPRTGGARALTPALECPFAVREAWGGQQPAGTPATSTLLAVTATAAHRFVLDARLQMQSHRRIPFPTDWSPALVQSEEFAVGRFTDTNTVAAAIAVRGDGVRACRFEFHEYRGDRWVLNARPATRCSNGDFGTPRFAYESKDLFDEAVHLSGRGELDLTYAVTREVQQHSTGMAAQALIAHGRAEQLSSNTFRTGVPADEERSGWYHAAFDFDGQRATVFYKLLIVDFVHVTDVYVQPAGTSVAHRMDLRRDDDYPSLVGRHLVCGSTVVDIVTGRPALPDPLLLPFWYW
jgi:hypothetical protein